MLEIAIRNHINTCLPKITQYPLCIHSIYNLIHVLISVPVAIILQKKRGQKFEREYQLKQAETVGGSEMNVNYGIIFRLNKKINKLKKLQ